MMLMLMLRDTPMPPAPRMRVDMPLRFSIFPLATL